MNNIFVYAGYLRLFGTLGLFQAKYLLKSKLAQVEDLIADSHF